MRYGLLASLLLHAALLAILVFRQPAPVASPRHEIAVSIVYIKPQTPVTASQPVLAKANAVPAQRQRLTADEIVAAARKAVPVKPVKPVKPVETAPQMIVATRLYAAKMLADPRSRGAKKALMQLAPDERIIQLCNSEAMEQIHRWKARFDPDLLVAYALADIRMGDTQLEADGAAFRSAGDWYGVKYRCGFAPDRAKIASFAFLVGEAIPKAEWASHNLTAGDGDDDQ
jgi:hypothetical protein